MPTIRTILHPTDFSADSRPAFEAACSFAGDYGARLILLHVGPPSVTVCRALPVLPEGTRLSRGVEGTPVAGLLGRPPSIRPRGSSGNAAAARGFVKPAGE